MSDKQFGFSCPEQAKPLCYPTRLESALIQVRLARMDDTPTFHPFARTWGYVLYSGIKHRTRFCRCRFHECQNRVLVHSSEALDCADAHSLKHHGKSLRRRLRVGVVVAEFGSGFRKGEFAGNAAIPLNMALSVGAKLTDYVVTAFAGHDVFPLRFSGESATISLRLDLWLTPRFGLAPPPVDAGSGALTYKLLNWWWRHSLHLRFATARRLAHVEPFVFDTSKSFLPRRLLLKVRQNPEFNGSPFVFSGTRIVSTANRNFASLDEPVDRRR